MLSTAVQSSDFFYMEKNKSGSVADPDSQDPYVFEPPGSGSGSSSTEYGSGSFYNQAKIVRKTLNNFYDFVTSL